MIDTTLKRHSIVGVAASRSQAKTSCVLGQLKALRKKYPKLQLAVMGISPKLNDWLQQHNIKILYNRMDILDLRLRDTVIFVDEFALLFDSKAKSKQQDKLSRFFDRLEHQNCKIIISTAREGYYNKYMCSRITAFIVKQVEYESLVNGTWLKERVTSIESNSDYRLEVSKDEYYVVDKGDSLTKKYHFAYDEDVDTKKDNCDLFGE